MSFIREYARDIIVGAFKIRGDPLPDDAVVSRMVDGARNAEPGSIPALIAAIEAQFEAYDAGVDA